ncbi:MAG: hypothetical protein AB7U73_19925 [Pirellulales bacterium]
MLIESCCHGGRLATQGRQRGVVLCLALFGGLLVGLPTAQAQQDEPAGEASAQGPAPSVAERALELRELLELLGVDESYFRALMDGRPVQPDESEALLRLLYAVRRVPLLELRGALPAARPLDVANLPPKGSRVEVAGRLRSVATETPPPELIDRLEMPQYYRCEVQLADGQPAIVYVDVVPQAWQTAAPADQRVGATGFLAKLAGDAGETPTPVVVATRLAWYPDSPLGDLGMDYGLFDTVRQKRPLTSEDRTCFYEMLDCLQSADTQQLYDLATERLTPTSGGDVARRLLQKPADEMGKLVFLEGVARRAIRVEVTDPDVRRRWEVDHYFEVDMIFRDVRVRYEPAKRGEGAPPADNDDTGPLVVTCNLLELPRGMPTGDRISEMVRVPAFFFKLWGFQSELADEAGHDHLQYAPLFLASGAEWIEQPPVRSYTWVFSLLLVVILGGAVLAIWGMNRADRRRREQAAAAREAVADPAFLTQLERGESSDAGG